MAMRDAQTSAYTIDGIIGLIFGVCLLVALVAILAVVLRHRRASRELLIRSQAAPGNASSPVGVLSPDRAYWWNGVAWVSSASEAPPNALRSPDGLQWYDGTAWRPLSQPAPKA